MDLTDEIRDAFAVTAFRYEDMEAQREKFDAWLRKVKAGAWEHGTEDARGYYAGGTMPTNPYRQEA